MASLRTVLLAVAAVLLSSAAIKVNARDFTWTGASFDWPCATTKAMYKSGGKYIPKNIIATKALIFKDDAIVALPRYLILSFSFFMKVHISHRNCCSVALQFCATFINHLLKVTWSTKSSPCGGFYFFNEKKISNLRLDEVLFSRLSFLKLIWRKT